ncbi:Ppx/GppA phosphatase family protein [Alteromonas sp. a30]|uniref:Ppx/GppA phosphatase family protein n=1 Tax=Alteromonas sp. a30 TaxID=2730917 RepID=UPI00227FB9EE|nr:guanosine-5'-triphosphate,3'-diphosphate pyrophosphatase [Alteromonas sp. a30]MCY7295700.1 guanosine-5'-triphosphate,3'-diphosphate pyrophosphatase [Alteromonas sp. a30]
MDISLRQPQLKVTPDLYAAVDLGSNSFHMVVVSVAKGHVQIINRIKQKVRLASGLDKNNNLDDASMIRGWQCLAMFAERLQDIPSDNIRIVATATIRLAKNADVFVAEAEKILNHSIRVISGEEEARQIYSGVTYTSVSQGNTLVIDIGGASTEIIIGNGFEPIDLVSLNMGCVTYMERHFPKGKITKKGFDEAIKAAKEMLAPVLPQFTAFSWEHCLGASGTPQALDEMLSAQGINDSIRLEYLQRFKQDCCDCRQIEKLDLVGLHEHRRSIFPSGLAILIALFESLNIESMQISGGALREGIIYNMLEERNPQTGRVQTVEHLVERFFIDVHQANRVKELSLQFFKQLNLQSYYGFDLKVVLEVAAILHEIGLQIEYKKHHLHGAYILQNLPLIGFSRQQQDCIRILVRNHREEMDLQTLSVLSAGLQPNISILIRILRLSNALCVRRKDDVLPSISLSWEQQVLSVLFPKGWLDAHPLISAELESERQFQSKVGWKLHYA